MSGFNKVIITFSALLSLTIAATTGIAEDAASYKLTKTISIGAPDKWDYLHFDPDSGRLYVAHGNLLTVLDGTDGKIVGTMDATPGGSHGIAIVTSEGKGYTDDGKNGTVISFDLKTLKPLKTIKAQEDADGIIFDKASGHIFVIDGDSAKITVIDPKTDNVIATIDGGGKLEFGVSGENGKIYVDGAEKNDIVRIDTATNKADAHWSMPDCGNPRGIAIDKVQKRIFASCKNAKLVVVNAETGKEITALPIGQGTDAAQFDPTRNLIFSSNFDGTLSVISALKGDKYAVQDSVKTAVGARTMTLDEKTGRIYLVTADYTVNDEAKPSDLKHRYKIIAGSAKVLFFDPVKP